MYIYVLMNFRTALDFHTATSGKGEFPSFFSDSITRHMPNKYVKWRPEWLKVMDENGDCIGLWARQQGEFKARCVWCNKDVAVRNGLTNLQSHSTAEKHRAVARARRSSSSMMSNLVVSKKNEGSPASASVDSSCSGNTPDAPRVAEIRCVTRIVLKGHSFESESDLAEDLRAICSDSKIPPRMQLGSTKIAYLLTEALYPHLRETILTDVRNAKWFALHLDESNKGAKYLGIVVRYLPKDSFDVRVVCLGLPSLQCTSAEDISDCISEMVNECRLDKANCLAVMSDNCNVMRGAKSGVVVRLKKEHGFSGLVDVGGCSLHHIHNVAKHACESSKLGLSVEALVRDIYCHFKYCAREQDRLENICADFEEIKKLVFLRPVGTRWLQILSVVERLLGMFPPLKRYFAETKPNGSNFKSIKDTLQDPKTEFFLCFLVEVLKPLLQFELIFQQDGCHVHELYTQLMDLMKRWLLRFIQPSCLPEKFWKVDSKDHSIQLSPYQLGVGERARRLFNNMTSENQQACLLSVRAFFATGTAKLQDYIPFGNKFLRACQLLNPRKQFDPHAVSWARTLASHLPEVIRETDVASLEVEVRLHRHELEEVPQEESGENSTSTVAEFWSAVASRGKQPLLVGLVRALLILPHGNAEVERVFSRLKDTVTKKRERLAPLTVQALIVSASCLNVKKWTASSLPMSPQLLNLCSSAHASYCRRLRDQEAAAKEARRKDLEKQLFGEVEAEKKASKRYVDVSMELELNNSQIEDKIKEKQAALKLLEEVQKEAKKKEEELEGLRVQQEKLRKKKEQEANVATTTVIKRAASQITDSFSSPESVRNKKFRID